MFSTLLTKKNLPALLTISILVFTIGILFWYGQNKIQEAQNIQTTIIAWENLDNQITSSIIKTNNLNLFIQNITPQKINYKIEWLLNEKIIDSQKIDISAQDKKIIPPTKKVVNELTTLLNNSTTTNNQNQISNDVLYQIKITWEKNKKGETLGKWLSL